MTIFIPLPLDSDDFDIEVDEADDFTCSEGHGDTCRRAHEQAHVADDLVIAMTPRWLWYAVGEVLAGRAPATQVYLSPVLTGGPEYDLGFGPRARPMQFGGQAHRGDGEGCDDADPRVLPAHEALAPATALAPRRTRDSVEVEVYDDFESLTWPSWRATGAAKA